MLSTISYLLSQAVSSSSVPVTPSDAAGIATEASTAPTEALALSASDLLASSGDAAGVVVDATAKQSDLFVVLLGLGTVFAGLIAIIVICKLMGLFFAGKSQKDEDDDQRSQTVAIEDEEIPDRQEMVAAISAVLAEELGTDVSAIRIHSITRV